MTCAHADENCPIIPGAEERISLQYDDPKAFDNTPLETEKYDERSLQIASELLYVFKSVGE
jgi:arsenate reductase